MTTSQTDIIIFVRENIKNDRRLTNKKVANEVSISISFCHLILSVELGMKRVSHKINTKNVKTRTKRCNK